MKRPNLVRTALVVSLGMMASNAWAIIPVIDVGVIGAVSSASSAITAAISTTTTAVSTAATSINTLANSNFQLLYQVVKGVGVEQAQATNEASKMVAAANTRTAFEVERSKIVPRFSVTNPCSVIAAQAGMATANRNASVAAASVGRGGAGGGGGVVAGSGGANNDLARAIAISKGTVAAPAPEVAAKLAASGACSAFAAGTRAGDCQAAQFATGQANPFANADINAETLFDGPQSAGSMKKKFTVDNTPGSNERTAMEAFVRNMGTPLELRSLGAGELGSDAGRRYLAVKDSFEGRMSLGLYPVRRHVGMMTASLDTKPVLDRLVTSVDGPWITTYLNNSSPTWAAKGISSDDLMELEVERRYMNKGWMTRAAATMTPEEVARETLMNGAFQNVLLWKLNQEMRNNGILLGTLVTTAIRSESLPELKAAHTAAAR